MVFERKLVLSSFDPSKLNVLNMAYFEDNKTPEIIFNNRCLITSDTNLSIYSQIYRYLVCSVIDRADNIIYAYNKYLNEKGLQLSKINCESYLLRTDNLIQIETLPSFPKNKTCLIIAFYFGERTKNETFHNLIDIQNRFLKKYKHGLAKIVFAIAEDNRKSISIEEKDGITYFYKPNLGLSFGSWNMVINHYRDTYDHYILGEDDYVFVKDNFDQILLTQYQEKKAEYLVTWKSLRGKLISTIGIVSSQILKKYNYLNDIDWTMEKDRSMWTFLTTFSSIKPLPKEYSAFPYWGIMDHWDVWLFDYVNGESELDYLNRTIVAAVQFIDQHDNLKIPQISNVLVIEDNLDLVKYH